MGVPKSWHIVSYDVREPKRWRRVYRILRGYGDHVQLSVFRVRGSRTEIERMRFELEEVLAPADDLLVVPVCETCVSRVAARGPRAGVWTASEALVRIAGEPSGTDE